MVMRASQASMTGVHGDSAMPMQGPAEIAWIAMPGRALPPGRSTDFRVSIGPMPTVSRIAFTVLATYAGATTATAMPPVSLTLTPAATAQTGNASGGGGAATDPDAALFAQLVAENKGGPSVLSVAGWVVAVLVAIGAGVLIRRRPAAAGVDAEPETVKAELPEPETAREIPTDKELEIVPGSGQGAELPGRPDE
jgi:hypothetical protein